MTTEPSPTIAVTGSTGRLGGRIAQRLSDAGVPQLLLARAASRAPHLPGATAAAAEYGNAKAVTRALAGIDTVLMVSATESPERLAQHQTFIDAASAAGVRHLVYISFFGASATATFTHARVHWHTEQHLRRSGLDFTFLRDNFYLDFLPELISDQGLIAGPGGTGRVTAVAQDDIADAAGAILQAPRAHIGATYDLTGPEALTLADVAATISKLTGRKITYHEETPEEAYASRRIYDAPDWVIDSWVSTYTAIANGELDGVSTAIPDLTGHPATSLRQFLQPQPTPPLCRSPTTPAPGSAETSGLAPGMPGSTTI